ncbi:MAG: oligoribonuclease [Bdellovibrionota bacterium]
MNYLFWIDMEMSGLVPEKHRILEVALVVTNTKFETVQTYENIIYQEPSVLASMDEWCTKHHGESGLSARVAHGKQENYVEQELLEIIQKYSPKEKAILAGNSIGQDRKFIDIWMPKLAQTLHYRMLDVSSFKIVFEGIYNQKFEKQKKHRAVDDILESIAELKYYLSFLTEMC